MLVLLMLFTFRSIAQEPIIILGTDNPLSEVIVKIDLLRVCSNPTNNVPNYFVEKDGNTINLRISFYQLPNTVLCDPLPPWVTSYLDANLGQLEPGEYELNIFLVPSNESVITGTPVNFGPFLNPVFFQVLNLKSIPTLSSYALIICALMLFFTGILILRKDKINITQW
ncbi:MAG: hypothetical protein AB8B80_13685 [Marinicellaceae bacterium]